MTMIEPPPEPPLDHPASLFVVPRLWADMHTWHERVAELRAETPVITAEFEGYAPFTVLTRHEDIAAIERDHTSWLNTPFYATLATGVFPRWTGWVAYVAAAINLVAAPSIFGGTDYTGFYTASGYVTFIGQGAMVIWFLIASVSMLVVKREAKAMTPVYGG